MHCISHRFASLYFVHEGIEQGRHFCTRHIIMPPVSCRVVSQPRQLA